MDFKTKATVVIQAMYDLDKDARQSMRARRERGDASGAEVWERVANAALSAKKLASHLKANADKEELILRRSTEVNFTDFDRLPVPTVKVGKYGWKLRREHFEAAMLSAGQAAFDLRDFTRAWQTAAEFDEPCTIEAAFEYVGGHRVTLQAGGVRSAIRLVKEQAGKDEFVNGFVFASAPGKAFTLYGAISCDRRLRESRDGASQAVSQGRLEALLGEEEE